MKLCFTVIYVHNSNAVRLVPGSIGIKEPEEPIVMARGTPSSDFTIFANIMKHNILIKAIHIVGQCSPNKKGVLLVLSLFPWSTVKYENVG